MRVLCRHTCQKQSIFCTKIYKCKINVKYTYKSSKMSHQQAYLHSMYADYALRCMYHSNLQGPPPHNVGRKIHHHFLSTRLASTSITFHIKKWVYIKIPFRILITPHP